ncbi:MAG: shikimate kinase [Gemmataceae bacterium]|nr:shikimate kinase [Gemmataceae bacterium]
MTARFFLVGPRCAGKTTVGRLLARRLQWDHVDTDDRVTQRAGRTVAELFDDVGEAGFRQLESDVLAEVAGRSQVVVSTGGGIVLAPANRHLLQTAGVTVWLTAPADVLHARMIADPATAAGRPTITIGDREPLYREVARFTLDTASLSPEEAVSAILAACGNS